MSAPRCSLPSHSLVSFSVQLGLMLDSGVPIMRALQVLRGSNEAGLGQAVDRLADSVNQGHLLSGAMSRLPDCFSPMYVKLIHSGEASGRITEVLRGLARELERSERQAGRMKQALVYPLTVFLISGAMAAFMVYYMLPQFLVLFRGFGEELPLPTQILMTLVYNPQIRICLPLVFFVLPALIYHQRRRPDVAHLLQQLQYGLPLLGSVNRQMAMARFCGHLSMMGQQGVLLLEGLNLLRGTTGYQELDLALADLATEIKGGATLGQALRVSSLFPSLIVHSVVAGEESSDLFVALGHCATMLEEQAQLRLDALLSMLEPLVMGVMGVVVGFIVLATFMPIYQLAALKF